MPDSWKAIYADLKEYIARNPLIKIDKKLVIIPGDVRPEFNLLFNKVRTAFIKDNCQTLLDEAIPYSNNYTQVEQEVKQALGIKTIKLTDDLKWLLDDPVNGLSRLIYYRLFDLIKGKLDINTFEIEAVELISVSLKQLLQLGYEKWVTLSLVNLLIPDKALVIHLDDIIDECHEPEWEEKKGFNEQEVPELKELQMLSLMREFGKNVFMTSNLIVHSAKINRYASIGTDLKDATWAAKEVSGKREWHTLRKKGAFYKVRDDWPDIVVYIDDQPENIGLIADFLRFCKPDVIVECRNQADWYQEGGLDKVRKHYDFFKPRLGSYVVSRLPVPEEVFKDLTCKSTSNERSPKQSFLQGKVLKDQSLDIHILTVGFNQSRLAPIIDILLSNNITPT